MAAISGIFKHLLFENSAKFKANSFAMWWTSMLFKHNMTLEKELVEALGYQTHN
jgi:hypothetical protein